MTDDNNDSISLNFMDNIRAMFGLNSSQYQRQASNDNNIDILEQQRKHKLYMRKLRKNLNQSDYKQHIINQTQYNIPYNLLVTRPNIKLSNITKQELYNNNTLLPCSYINKQTTHNSSIHIPNTLYNINQYDSRIFCSLYNKQGNRFAIASQDQYIRIYNTYNNDIVRHNILDNNINDWSTIRDPIECRNIGWSIIDTDFSSDGQFVIYSTWSNYIQLVNVTQSQHDIHESLDLCPQYAHDRFCAFSIKFSNNNHEILCGGSDSNVYLYDIVSKQRLFVVNAHTDDVNAVCFADDNNNVFVSGSDDAAIRIWDKRMLSNDNNDNNIHNTTQQQRRPYINRNNKPVGSFIGHTDGITYIDSKQDNIYFISNSKDQTARLWDIRKTSAYNTTSLYNEYNTDYRWGRYYRPQPSVHRRGSAVQRRMGTRANPSSSDIDLDNDDNNDNIDNDDVDSDDIEYTIDSEEIEEDDDSDSDVDEDEGEGDVIEYEYEYNVDRDNDNDANMYGYDDDYGNDNMINNSLIDETEQSIDLNHDMHDDDNDYNTARHSVSNNNTDSQDNSVMMYRGHSVRDTLIRVRFSPLYNTAQQYIYTGSADGCVYIYDVLTGRLVQKLCDGHRGQIRDVYWHPYLPQIMSSGWDGLVCKWNYKPINNSRRRNSSNTRHSSVDSTLSYDD